MKELKTKLEVFSMGQLQNFKTLAKILLKENVSLEQYIEFIEKELVISKKNVKRALKKCPGCSRIMRLFPVNTSRADQTGDDSNSVWFCKHCLLENFNKETIQEIIKRRS